MHAVRVTEPLVNHILQDQDSTHDHEDDRQADQAFEEALSCQRDATKRQREEWDTGMQEKAKALRERLGHDSTAALAMRWAEQRGTSTWLTALPLVSHGFDLTRREFYDALCLRYGWEPAKMPTTCACGQRFSLEHALTCRRGGYITMRHDEVRDLFTTLLSETCHNVSSEPELQPLNGAPLHTRGANRTDGARLDIKAGASGVAVGSRQHFLMCGCSTLMLPLTDCRHPRPSSKPTTGKNVASTKNEFGKSKVPALRHWSSPALEQRDESPKHS